MRDYSKEIRHLEEGRKDNFTLLAAQHKKRYPD
jgi:hypothetical protein